MGAVVLSILATGIAISSCGSSGTDAAPPFAVSEAEVRAECLTGTFVPEETGFEVLQKKPPSSWQLVEDAPQAMQAERGAVLVTLRPKGSGGKVTFTDIKFEVDNLGLRPVGTVFYKPCRRRLAGAAIEGDLDRLGRVHKSNASLTGALGKGFFVPEDAQPIDVPWTVSLKQPLHLYLVVEAYDIWARWSASLAWKSASGHGVIHVDNDGRKYEVVDGAGTGWYRPSQGKWVSQGESRWIGVR